MGMSHASKYCAKSLMRRCEDGSRATTTPDVRCVGMVRWGVNNGVRDCLSLAGVEFVWWFRVSGWEMTILNTLPAEPG